MGFLPPLLLPPSLFCLRRMPHSLACACLAPPPLLFALCSPCSLFPLVLFISSTHCFSLSLLVFVLLFYVFLNSLRDAGLSEVFELRTAGLPHFVYQRREFAAKAAALSHSFLEPSHESEWAGDDTKYLFG